ncbi:rRNA maturation RNase YbeY [bacterium]|nr:rRNA maturation RNase YbeY [bacterium]
MNDNIRVIWKNFRLKKWLEKKIELLAKEEKFSADKISVVIVDDQTIKKINKKYRNKNKVTDVLSFADCDVRDFNKFKNEDYLGEIFINFADVQRNYSDLKEGVLKLLIHAYLHLRGYLHNTEDEYKTMIQESEKLIKKIK